ncbi:MAG: hypothetical protein AAB036_08220 [Elusimicrobiota bacterium]
MTRQTKGTLIDAIWCTVNSTNELLDQNDGYEPDPGLLRNFVKKFEDFGGDKRFLEFLRNYPQSQIPRPRTRRQLVGLKRKGRQLLKLHGVLSRDPLFAADARLGELRSIADSISKLRSFRGAPIKRSELYFWLAALVPYTLHVTRDEPRWGWIGQWICELTGKDLEKPQTYWDKVIQPKVQGKILVLEIKSALHDGAMAYREWLQLRKPRRPSWKQYVFSPSGAAPRQELLKHVELRRKIWSRRPSEEERRYDQTASRCLPILAPLFKIPFPKK